MQFPNGMQKVSTTVAQRVKDEISIRPFAFVLKLLQIAMTAKIDITKRMLGYYVLNSLDVLQGKASPYEVLEAIEKDIKAGIERDIVVPGKATSFTHQHINEQINYLELANLIRIIDENHDKRVVLNLSEMETIELFIQEYDKKPAFDVYSYDLGTIEERKIFQFNWDAYYARLSEYASKFTTSSNSLSYKEGETSEKDETKKQGQNLVQFGDEGEALVYEYEKNRVSKFNPHLVRKVLALGKTRGIGYDIQSVIAEPGDMAEFVKYIEVKSTKRFTCPDLQDSLWIDTLNITRNEYVAAKQHGEFYYIYRVYFTSQGVTMFIIGDVGKKLDDGRMQATPMTYRVDFSSSSVDGTETLQSKVTI